MSQIQSVLFNKHKYSTNEARAWLKLHKFVRKKKVDITKNLLRYRIREPSNKYNYRIKKIEDGIQFVIMYKK